MPRYYCDYCDTYLTHDSPSVRKQHNAGYKHKANVRQYYQQFEEQQTQSLIDQKVKEHLGQTAAYQHLAALGQYRPPMAGLPRPGMPIPGGMPPNPMQGMMQGLRPPVLQPPPAGYNAPPGVVTYRPPVAAIPTSGAAAPQPMRPPTLTPPGAPIARSAAPTTMSNGPSSVSPGAYQPLMGSYNYSSQTGSTNGYAQPPNAPGSNPGAYGARPTNSSPSAVSAPPGQNSFSYSQTSAVPSGMGQLSPPMGSPPASFRS